MIKASYRGIPIEVLDVYQREEVKFAAIHSLDDEPFVVDAWPVKARYATVNFDQLEDFDPDWSYETKQLTLLDIALTYWAKRQWYAGESIWLWRTGNQGAFLKEEAGMFITLNITCYQESLNIFRFDPNSWAWELCRDLKLKYQKWATRAKDELG